MLFWSGNVPACTALVRPQQSLYHVQWFCGSWNAASRPSLPLSVSFVIHWQLRVHVAQRHTHAAAAPARHAGLASSSIGMCLHAAMLLTPACQSRAAWFPAAVTKPFALLLPHVHALWLAVLTAFDCISCACPISSQAHLLHLPGVSIWYIRCILFISACSMALYNVPVICTCHKQASHVAVTRNAFPLFSLCTVMFLLQHGVLVSPGRSADTADQSVCT